MTTNINHRGNHARTHSNWFATLSQDFVKARRLHWFACWALVAIGCLLIRSFVGYLFRNQLCSSMYGGPFLEVCFFIIICCAGICWCLLVVELSFFI